MVRWCVLMGEGSRELSVSVEWLWCHSDLLLAIKWINVRKKCGCVAEAFSLLWMLAVSRSFHQDGEASCQKDWVSCLRCRSTCILVQMTDGGSVNVCPLYSTTQKFKIKPLLLASTQLLLKQ
jgi:hypothetical protein